MRRMSTRRLLILCVLLVGCAAPQPLSEYAADASESRQNLPGSYVDYLRTSRFTHGEIDHLPPYAILLHGDPESLLPAAASTGHGGRRWSWAQPTRASCTSSAAGRDAVHGQPRQPRRGRRSHADGELAALGARFVVHIGTSGLLGPPVTTRT